uniref:Transposase Tc1-like domain-containing protein n=1 Tax=Amphimedon queenslandica TaxID=400682 RepID=A0A1X7TUU3_AMPQE
MLRIIEQKTGVQVSGSTVCCVLRRNGFTRKKIQVVAKQRSISYRSHFMAEILQFSPHQLVWIDETGSDGRSHERNFEYSLRGLPPVCHRMVTCGKQMSAIAAYQMRD